MLIRLRLIYFCLLSPAVIAQSYRTDIRHRPMFWSEVNAVYKVTDKWGLQLDLQYRRQASDNRGNDINAFRYPLQNVFRPWIYYQLSKPVRLSLSPIGLWWTWGRQSASQPTTFFQELRTTQQLQTTHPLGDGQFITRYRSEFRWLSRTDSLNSVYGFLSDNESLPVGGNRFSVRLRAMARWLNPVFGPSSAWYTHLSIEPMLSMARSGTRFDQNRIYVALGRRMQENLRLELGYMNQFAMQKNDMERLRTVRFNHALHVFIFLENRRPTRVQPPSGPD